MIAALRVVLSLAFLLVVWLGWSGLFKPLLITLGVISCGLVVVLGVRMGSFQEESYWLRIVPRLPAFWLWLFKEVVRSNIAVAKIILSPRPKVSPALATITALPPDRIGQATLGNCITLTPGTVTLDDHEGKLTVHCITRGNAEELEAGEMNRRVARLTRR
jgi:multicomponent Na+:H+ antiporter subunit E